MEYRPTNTLSAQGEASAEVNRASTTLARCSAHHESRHVQTTSEATCTEILVSTQGPIPPSHPPFPHWLQHRELMWPRLLLIPPLGTTLGKAASPSCSCLQAHPLPSQPAAHFELQQTNKKIQETFVNLRFAQLQSGLQVPPFLHFSTSLPLPLSPEHKSHIQGIMINVCNQIPTKQRLSTAILLICQDARGAHPYSPFITLGQLQNKNKTPTHRELLLHPCTQSPSRNFNFRSSQLSQHLPHPPRTTNAGFLHGPGLFMCRARKRIAFAEAMNDLSSR